MATRENNLVSSVINRVSYDEDSQSMTINFRSGRSYTIDNVPVDIYDGMVEAASPGRYFNDVIKGNY